MSGQKWRSPRKSASGDILLVVGFALILLSAIGFFLLLRG